MQTFLRFWLYPLLLLTTLIGAALTLHSGMDLKKAFAVFISLRFIFLLFVEWRWPAKTAWAMTINSFLRDLKYMILFGGGGYIIKLLVGWLAIDSAASSNGSMTQQPLFIQLLIYILFYEFIQYWLHRISHEARGPIGRFLWRSHSVHHLPKRVYLLMHPVMHPINALLVISINLGCVYVLNVGAEAVFIFNVLLGLQGLVSHFNSPTRAGFLNYVLIGTELHRYHHSANMAEAGNYGALTPVWDLVFGTFRYFPAAEPLALGVSKPEHYPSSNELLRCMHLPFQPTAKRPPQQDEP